MRRSQRAAVLLPVFLSCFLVLLPSGAPAQQDPLRGLDAYIEKAMREWELPGLAIAVVRNDSIVYAKGFGVRELGRPERVDENTLFAVASNSKAVTGTGLALLAREGKLGWNDRVRDHLPELELWDPYVTRELTVRDLLTHRVGYGTWAGDLLWYGSDLPTAEVLRRLRHLQPNNSFRNAYGYSNLMFVAGGAVLERVSGSSWQDFARQRFFEPLGMTRTNTSTAALPRAGNVAAPHTKLDGRVLAVAYRPLDNAAPAAAVNSSVREWANWLRLHLNDGVFEGKRVADSAAIVLTRTPQFTLPLSAGMRRMYPSMHFHAYGLGWFLNDYQGRLLVTHSGGMDGMVSYTGFVPEAKVGIAIFTNYDEQNLYVALFHYVLDRMLGAPVKDYSRIYLDQQNAAPAAAPAARPVAGTRPSLPLEQYAGTYANELLGEAVVSVVDGALQVRLQHHAGLRGPLAHWHFDTFQADWADPYMKQSLVTFAVDPSGRVRDFRMKVREDFVDPLEYVFRRTR